VIRAPEMNGARLSQPQQLTKCQRRVNVHGRAIAKLLRLRQRRSVPWQTLT